jgi:hypothetical protein
MSTQKLTTDLIADCLTLIPENLEALNTNPLEISVNYSQDKTLVFAVLDKEGEWEMLGAGYRFLIISHCLRNIPEFQDENPKITELNNELIKFNTPRDREYRADVRSRIKVFLQHKPTISSATLHGQGEFPPSTLEELCESYKNVMSK